MSLSSLGQFALPVVDVDRAEVFYGQVLGLRKLFRFDNLVFFDCAGVRLMLEGEDAVEVSSGVCHYFRTQNIDATYAELLENGAEFYEAPHLIVTMPDHELWMAFFRDPDGHTLALMEERKLG
ncbi:MAG: VOC family protein [Pseudomonadales bacterium]